MIMITSSGGDGGGGDNDVKDDDGGVRGLDYKRVGLSLLAESFGAKPGAGKK